MSEAIYKLRKLQAEINSRVDDSLYEESLMFGEFGNLLKIYFFGNPSDESFDKVLEVLSDKEVAERLGSLSFDSPDEGTNGTNNYDFSALAENRIIFPSLRSFSVKLTQPENHNGTIIARMYDEEGMIAKLIKKMPSLLSMQIPSAPNEEFFELNSHPLEHLTMQVGFDTQNFILNLSNSTCFKNLRYFDFTDYQETYMENWKDVATPFEHFERLINSKAFDSVRLMILRNLTFSVEQIRNLKLIRKNTVFKLIRTESNYIY